jgi:Nickel responsive protein SCO4226-like
MPRYVIERVFGEAVEEDMGRIGSRSRRIAEEEFPDIKWEHSYVVSDESGVEPGIKTFCIYEAPSEERVRQHAQILGEHEITNLYEIGAVVTPADFAT